MIKLMWVWFAILMFVFFATTVRGANSIEAICSYETQQEIEYVYWRIDFAKQTHAYLLENPNPVMGDADWQRGWVSDYERTQAILSQAYWACR